MKCRGLNGENYLPRLHSAGHWVDQRKKEKQIFLDGKKNRDYIQSNKKKDIKVGFLSSIRYIRK